MEQYDQISERDGTLLSSMKLHDAEQMLMARYVDAQNEMALVYKDVHQPAISFRVSARDSKEVEIGDTIEHHPPGPASAEVTITHNHPNAAPLSDSDVHAAVKNNLKSVRAVGRYGAFSLERPPEGWPELTGMHLDILNAAHEQARSDMRLEQRGLTAADVNKGSRDQEIAQLEQWIMLEHYAAATHATFRYQELIPSHDHAPGRREQLRAHLDATYRIRPSLEAARTARRPGKRRGSVDLGGKFG